MKENNHRSVTIEFKNTFLDRYLISENLVERICLLFHMKVQLALLSTSALSDS